jgi:hypothetical protein
MVFAVKRDKAAIRDEAREQTAFVNRHHRIALGMQHENGAFDLAGGVRHIRIPADPQQANGGFG